MIPFYRLCLMALFIQSASILQGQEENLKLIKVEDGISIFKEKDAHDNLDRVVAVTTVSYNYKNVLALIKDYRNHENWIYANHGGFIIDSISAFKWIYYGISETPWPFQDRDVVTRVKMTVDNEKKQIKIQSLAEPDIIPQSQEMVRIVHLESDWYITKIDENHTEVKLDIMIDVGGGIPNWLVKLFASVGPLSTFKNIPAQLAKPKYKNCRNNHYLFFEK